MTVLDFTITNRFTLETFVITQGTTSTWASDPKRFPKQAMLVEVDFDGELASASTCVEAKYSQNATFINRGVDAITLTNGARVEWLPVSLTLQQHQLMLMTE